MCDTNNTEIHFDKNKGTWRTGGSLSKIVAENNTHKYFNLDEEEDEEIEILEAVKRSKRRGRVPIFSPFVSNSQLTETELELMRQSSVINYGLHGTEIGDTTTKEMSVVNLKYQIQDLSARNSHPTSTPEFKSSHHNEKVMDIDSSRKTVHRKQSLENNQKAKALSTFELLNNPLVLWQGTEYLTGLYNKNIGIEELDKNLGMSSDTNVEISPREMDICKHREINTANTATKCKRSSGRKLSSSLSKLEKEPTKTVEIAIDSKELSGQQLIRELLSRRVKISDIDQSDTGELSRASQRSSGLEFFVPRYTEKLKKFEEHSSMIKDLTLEQLVEHFNAIGAEIEGIWRQEIPSRRHDLYKTSGPFNELKKLNLSRPFNNQQGMYLLTHIYNLIVPDRTERPDYIEYVTNVALPETFIRIYARVTDLTYNMAEKELRFGPCYDDIPETPDNPDKSALKISKN